MSGIAAWKTRSILSSRVYEQTILPFFAYNTNPPILPLDGFSSILSRYFVSMINLQGISFESYPLNLFISVTIKFW